MTRRTLISGAAVLNAGALGLSTPSTIAAMAANMPPTVAKAYLGNHKPQPLPFHPAKIDGQSAKLMQSHWENNYQGAINALNAIELKIPGRVTDKDWPPHLPGDIKRE